MTLCADFQQGCKEQDKRFEWIREQVVYEPLYSTLGTPVRKDTKKPIELCS